MSVVAVVVHYGATGPTVDCVRSLTGAGFEVIVVDNGPEPAIAPALAALERVEVLATGANLGYAGGNNVGLRRAFERAEHALVVNNDVSVLDPGFADELVAALAEWPDAGIAGPIVVGPSGEAQPTLERYPSLLTAVALTLGRSRPLPAETREVEAVNGVCLLLSRAAFEATGGFDERYFMYGEEVDLAYRARQRGLRTLFVPAPSVLHHHAVGEERGRAGLFVRRNFVRFCLDHRGVVSAVVVALWFLLGAVARRRDVRALAYELRSLVPGAAGRSWRAFTSQVVDALVVPGLIALWILMLALGSAYDPQLRSVGSVGKFAVLALLAGVGLAAFAASPRRALAMLKPGLLHLLVAVLVALAAVSSLWSQHARHALAYAAALAVLFAAVTLAPWRLAQTGRASSVANGVFAGLALVVVGNALFAVADPQTAFLHAPGSGPRFRGFLESPDEIGAYVVALPLALWRVLAPGGRRVRLLGAFVATGFTFEVVASATRAGIALLAVVLVLMAVGYFGGARLTRRAMAVIAAGGTIVTLVLLSSAVVQQTWLPASVRPGTFQTLGGRTQAWSAAVELADRRPLTGFGLGEERAAIELYRSEGALMYQECLDASPPGTASYNACEVAIPRARRLFDFSGSYFHNSYLGLAVQLGWPIAVLATGFILAAIASIGAGVRRREPLTAALLAAALTGAAWALFSTYLWNPGNLVGGVFWLLLTLGVGCVSRRSAT